MIVYAQRSVESRGDIYHRTSVNICNKKRAKSQIIPTGAFNIVISRRNNRLYSHVAYRTVFSTQMATLLT